MLTRNRTRTRGLLAAGIALPVVVASAVATNGVASAATTACDVLKTSVFHVVNPTNQASLYTTSEREAAGAATNYKFTEDHGVSFKAYYSPRPDLVEVRRLYNARTSDFMWSSDPAETSALIKSGGYADQNLTYFTSPVSLSCTVPVTRLVNGAKHRFAATQADKDALVKAGWQVEKVAFYAAPGAPLPSPTPTATATLSPEDADGKFSIAVYPDTQKETGSKYDTRFIERSNWVVANQKARDTRFVAHSGDVVNWGWLVPAQYATADEAMKPIEAAGIPYALAIGNHDTRAVGHDGVAGSRGYGGAAYVSNPECLERFSKVECDTTRLVRHTEEFNNVFTAKRYTAVGGAFEAGKVDNIYSTFEAAGKKWMVLTLELWPRTEAVAWANKVVAEHPDHNVIVQTHSYLEGNGSITQNNGGYGTNSPQYVFDNLIKVQPNIKMVFSGHVGNTSSRVDTGVNGNKIVSYLEAVHSDKDNPLRMVEIDAKTGSVTTDVFGVRSGTVYEGRYTQTGLAFR